MSLPTNEDNRNEAIGKTICYISYWIYALKFIAVTSLTVLVVLYFLHIPLWLAPIIGTAIFLIYRSIRRAIFSVVLRFMRKD